MNLNSINLCCFKSYNVYVWQKKNHSLFTILQIILIFLCSSILIFFNCRNQITRWESHWRECNDSSSWRRNLKWTRRRLLSAKTEINSYIINTWPRILSYLYMNTNKLANTTMMWYIYLKSTTLNVILLLH